MSIKFDAELNAEIRDTVRNYNKRRLRLEKAGYKNVPEPILVSELKATYTKRSDLTRELERLRNIKRTDLTEKIENQGGVKAVKWEYDYLKANAKAAQEYFKREYERVSKRVGTFPGEQTYLNNIGVKIDVLSTSISYMNKSEFNAAVAYVTEFANYAGRRKAAYRGYLREVEWVMDLLGYPETEKKKFFNKFGKLTPSQFLYMFDNNSIIDRIYNLYHKDYGGEAFLTDSEDNARELIDELMGQADEMIQDAKENMD